MLAFHPVPQRRSLGEPVEQYELPLAFGLVSLALRTGLPPLSTPRFINMLAISIVQCILLGGLLVRRSSLGVRAQIRVSSLSKSDTCVSPVPNFSVGSCVSSSRSVEPILRRFNVILFTIIVNKLNKYLYICMKKEIDQGQNSATKIEISQECGP